jgi:hypothetical protein
MNFQEKVIEVASELRTRSLAFANTALKTARVRAQDATQRAAKLQRPLTTLSVSGRELNKVVRRHASRFVKQNATIARAAGKDVTALARETYENFTKSGVKKPGTAARKASAPRKRTRAKSAV